MLKQILLMCALMASASAATINLAWDANDPAEQILHYTIYEVSGGQSVKLIDTQETMASIAATPGVHTYAVTASNVWGESPQSNPVSTPGASNPPKGARVITIVLTVQ